MKIAVYTLPYFAAYEAKRINELFEAGLEELHIRKPHSSRKQYNDFIKSIDEKYYSKIVIHNHYSLIKKNGFKGIHIKPNFFKGIKGWIRKCYLGSLPNIQITTTIHKIDELDSLEGPFHGVFVGPLYKKYSEQNIVANFDSFEMRSAIANSNKSLLAMGGIDLKNTNRVENLGFSGMVLQSSIWKSDNVVNAFNAFSLQRMAFSNEEEAVRIA